MVTVPEEGERAVALPGMPIKCPICEWPLKRKLKDRSWDQLKRYHAEIMAWYMHWPEKHPSKFRDVTDFRKRIQMAAGHRTLVQKIPVGGLDPKVIAAMCTAAMRAAGSYGIAEPDDSRKYIEVYAPSSVALYNMKADDFNVLYDRCRTIFEMETGLNASQVFSETINNA